MKFGHITITKNHLELNDEDTQKQHAYQISKTQVRKLLTTLRKTEISTCTAICNCKYMAEIQYDVVKNTTGSISVGCKYFTRSEVIKVRKWAFSR